MNLYPNDVIISYLSVVFEFNGWLSLKVVLLIFVNFITLIFSYNTAKFTINKIVNLEKTVIYCYSKTISDLMDNPP